MDETEPLTTRDTAEDVMLASDESATFEPFEMPTEGDVPDLSDDDIASALGFSTTLSEPIVGAMGEAEAMEQGMGEEPTEEALAEEEPQEEEAQEEQEEETVEGEVSEEQIAQAAETDTIKDDIRLIWQEIGKLKGDKE